jgi:hypothetical protein
MPLQFMVAGLHEACAQQPMHAALSDAGIGSVRVLTRVLNFESRKVFSVIAARHEAGLWISEFKCAP